VITQKCFKKYVLCIISLKAKVFIFQTQSEQDQEIMKKLEKELKDEKKMRLELQKQLDLIKV